MITLFENFKNSENLPKIGDWIAIEPDQEGTKNPTKFLLRKDDVEVPFDEPCVGEVYYIDHFSTNKKRIPLSWFIAKDADKENFVLADRNSVAFKVYQDGILGWGKKREEAEAILQANKYNI